MGDIERKVTEGNVTAYYMDDSGVIEVKDLQIGSLKVDVNYTFYPRQKISTTRDLETMAIRFPHTSCNISYQYGKLIGVRVPAVGMGANTPEEIEAREWESANHEILCSSSKRLKKAKKIWDSVYGELMKVPLVQKYIDGLEDYVTEREEKSKKESAEWEDKRQKEIQELERKFKGKPDPLDSLVALVEAELQGVGSE